MRLKTGSQHEGLIVMRGMEACMGFTFPKMGESMPNLLTLMLICVTIVCFSNVCHGEGIPDQASELRVENGDAVAKLSWKINGDIRQKARRLKGFRLYQRREGTEMGFGITELKLLQDLKSDSSFKVTRLSNGECYLFVLKAYDHDGKEFWEKSLFALPGTNPRGRPERPHDLYGSAGDGRAAIFWDKNSESDIVDYEVYRQGPSETDYRRIAAVPKLFRTKETETHKGDDNYSWIVAPAAYQNAKLENGKTYRYKIRAVDKDGNFSDFTEPVEISPHPPAAPRGSDIVLLVNSNAEDENHNGINDSEEVARYYAERRGVPPDQIVRFAVPKDKYRFNYVRDIQAPLQEFLLKHKLAGTITYLVPCYGIPVGSGGRSLDSRISDVFDRFVWGRNMGTLNPFYGSARHFDASYGIYLVSRLDGPTVEIAKGLVDKALEAERNVTARSGRAFIVNDEWGKQLASIGKKLGVNVVLKPFTVTVTELLPDDAYWYFAWRHKYMKLRKGSWPVGAVASHLISDSFSGGFSKAAPANKNWVQGLLEDGITGTFGAVIEPYQQGYTRPDIFFGRFWTGEYTFAESFCSATPTVQWAMSAVGDPLFRLKSIK